jgi:hypothetical protein
MKQIDLSDGEMGFLLIAMNRAEEEFAKEEKRIYKTNPQRAEQLKEGLMYIRSIKTKIQ